MKEGNNYRKFLLLWAGELISSVGGGLTSFGLGVCIFRQTGSAFGIEVGRGSAAVIQTAGICRSHTDSGDLPLSYGTVFIYDKKHKRTRALK